MFIVVCLRAQGQRYNQAMKSLTVLMAVACVAVSNGQPKPIRVTIPEGNFEFTQLSLFHISKSSGKYVAQLKGAVENSTQRPWVYTRFRLIATGHTSEAPGKRVIKEIEFNIAGLPGRGTTEFDYPIDPMPYFEVDSYRLVWLEGKATSDESIAANKEAELQKEVEDYRRAHRFITYAVSGSTYSALVTFEKGDGGVQQKEISVPWSETISVEPGTFMSISAQSRQASGTIRVKILHGDVVLREAVSEGAYVIASTSIRIQ